MLGMTGVEGAFWKDDEASAWCCALVAVLEELPLALGCVPSMYDAPEAARMGAGIDGARAEGDRKASPHHSYHTRLSDVQRHMLTSSSELAGRKMGS